MTSNSVMTIVLRHFSEIGIFGGLITSHWLKIDPYYTHTVCDKNVAQRM